MQRRLRVTNSAVLLAALLGTALLGAIQTGRAGGDIVWVADYNAGMEQARQTGKPLLLSFHTPGCGWCRKLDAETFCDPKVVELSQQFVCVRLDNAVDFKIVDQYGVQAFPLTMILDSQGKERTRLTGYLSPASFAAALKTTLQSP